MVQSGVYRMGSRVYDLYARTHIMGVLNVTPDSFSDGGKFLSAESALRRALTMVEEGADIIDVGGESTRPQSTSYGKGADPVSAEEEMERVLPVVREIVKRTDVPVSIDTYKAGVARSALAAGAVMVNDISGFRFDSEMPGVVAAAGATVALMHIKGTPKTMQMNPVYQDLFGEIIGSLSEGVRTAVKHGIKQILVDPGIGFGKGQKDNLRLIAGLSRFRSLGCPILVGPSRKSFLGTILNLPVEDRLEGTLAAVVASVLNGAQVVRVHDVKAAKRAVLVADAIKAASGAEGEQSNVRG